MFLHPCVDGTTLETSSFRRPFQRCGHVYVCWTVVADIGSVYITRRSSLIIRIAGVAHGIVNSTYARVLNCELMYVF